MMLKAKVSTDVVMYDHRVTPAPKGVIVLCGNTELGTTVRSVFDEKAHDCWYPMPKFPDSCKTRYREKLRAEIKDDPLTPEQCADILEAGGGVAPIMWGELMAGSTFDAFVRVSINDSGTRMVGRWHREKTSGVEFVSSGFAPHAYDRNWFIDSLRNGAEHEMTRKKGWEQTHPAGTFF